MVYIKKRFLYMVNNIAYLSENQVENKIRSLSCVERSVYSSFVEYANLVKEVYVSQYRIAVRCGVSLRTVTRALRKLEALELIHTHNRGIYRTCIYTFPRVVTHSFGLRQRLSGLIRSFSYYSLVILAMMAAPISRMSHNNDTQVKLLHSYNNKNINSTSDYKRISHNKSSNYPKGEKFMIIDGKEVQVKYAYLDGKRQRCVVVGLKTMAEEAYRKEKVDAEVRSQRMVKEANVACRKASEAVAESKREKTINDWIRIRNMAEQGLVSAKVSFVVDAYKNSIREANQHIKSLQEK